MLEREIAQVLKQFMSKFLVISVLGPSQSGKTVLVKNVFKDYKYVPLEDIDTRKFAQEDPVGFLKNYYNKNGVIFDGVHNVPSLIPYIKNYVYSGEKKGHIILIGLQNIALAEAISKSFADSIATLTLLPLSIDEMAKNKILQDTAEKAIFYGCYPRIYDQNISPVDWYQHYIRAYVGMDVRRIKNIEDLTLFQIFMKLCAGRIGQLVNLTSLSNDCGISISTAKLWLSILEDSNIVLLLQPHHKNFNKRLVKTPKLYFYDTGLACSLLGITSEEQIYSHYLRGGLFESFIISDLMKQYYNKGMQPPVYFWRDKLGREVNCLIEKGDKLIAIDIKSGHTISDSYFERLEYWNSLSGENSRNSYVIYAGDSSQERKKGNVVSWKSLPEIFEKF